MLQIKKKRFIQLGNYGFGCNFTIFLLVVCCFFLLLFFIKWKNPIDFSRPRSSRPIYIYTNCYFTVNSLAFRVCFCVVYYYRGTLTCTRKGLVTWKSSQQLTMLYGGTRLRVVKLYRSFGSGCMVYIYTLSTIETHKHRELSIHGDW